MTLLDVWGKIERGEYEAASDEQRALAVHEFQEDLREVFPGTIDSIPREPDDDIFYLNSLDEWPQVWNFALGTVESLKTTIRVDPEHELSAWMKMVVDVVLNYYYYFYDFDPLEGEDVIKSTLEEMEAVRVRRSGILRNECNE